MAMDHKPNLDKAVQGNLESYNVVVADDDRTMAELLATNLRRLGHRVCAVASNGQEAIDLAIKHEPDVVLMDIHMPMVDGFQAAREILSRKLIPIVLSTGMTDSRSVGRAIDLNVISYLVKPFSPAQLKVAIHLAVAQCRHLSQPDALRAV